MNRQVLPHRRPSATLACDWQGHAITVTVGFDPATGAVCEVFTSVAVGGQMANLLADACVLISIALQFRIPAADLAKSLGRVPLFGRDAVGPASAVGTILDAILNEGHF